jgi:hypothetical protein
VGIIFKIFSSINVQFKEITSKVRLFADDTIAYLTISSDQDARTFQSDVDKLENGKHHG